MISKLKCLFACIFLLSCKHNTGQSIPTAANQQSLLWEVTGNGLEKPTYIFGTMHLLCADDAVLSDPMKQVIKTADEIYMELDMDDLGELFAGATAGFMKGDTTLKELLDSKDYDKVKNYFAQHGQAAEFTMLQKMQPLLTSAMVEANAAACGATNGMEMVILQEAKKSSKEIKGLETAAFQASIFNDIPYRQQAKELLSAIDSVDSNKQMMAKMFEVYKSQDIEKLYNFTQQGEFADEQIQDKLLHNRNRNWADKFPAITKGKSLLIAVGAGHLGGKKGVISLLKTKGYTLRPLQNNNNHL
jgi:uncharacterized protein